MEEIRLRSRYGDVKTIFHPIDESRGYITSTGNYVRTGTDKDNKGIEFIDFEGGPMIHIGSTLDNTNKKIKSIKACYFIELE